MFFRRLCAAVALYLLYLLSVSNADGYSTFVSDYCWRDYNGIPPPDALKAGRDKNGDPIYIGQTLYDNKLIPGKIHLNTQGIHIEFFEAFLINETIKILCTKQPQKFQWVKTQYQDIIKIKDKQLFEGGYEKNVKTYVGRAESHGELTVGKVICWPNRCIQLTTIENGTWYPHSEFEILVYKPSISQRESDSFNYVRKSPSFLSYFFLVLGTAVLVVLVIVLIRRC